MIYLKSVLVGITAAVVAAILWLVSEIALTAFMVSREMARTTGSGGIGAVSVPFVCPSRRLSGFRSRLHLER